MFRYRSNAIVFNFHLSLYTILKETRKCKDRKRNQTSCLSQYKKKKRDNQQRGKVSFFGLVHGLLGVLPVGSFVLTCLCLLFPGSPRSSVFPFQLHDLIEEAEESGLGHIVSWMPCGTMFKIHEKYEFARRFMQKYFRHSNYKSFLRQLSMYKFSGSANDRGLYYHPHFLKRNVQLCKLINRKEVAQSIPESLLSKAPGASNPTEAPTEEATLNELNYLLPCQKADIDPEILMEIIETFGSKSRSRARLPPPPASRDTT